MRFTQMDYVFLGYGVILATLLAYSARVVLRGRRLSRTLPPEERTWQ